MRREEEEGARGMDNVSWGIGGGSPPTRNSFGRRGREGAPASKEEARSAVRSVASVSLPGDAAAEV